LFSEHIQLNLNVQALYALHRQLKTELQAVIRTSMEKNSDVPFRTIFQSALTSNRQ